MYKVMPGAELRIKRVGDDMRGWIDHVATKPLFFSARESSSNGSSVFRQGGWIVIVRESQLETLEPAPGKRLMTCASCGRGQLESHDAPVGDHCPFCHSESSSSSSSNGSPCSQDVPSSSLSPNSNSGSDSTQESPTQSS